MANEVASNLLDCTSSVGRRQRRRILGSPSSSRESGSKELHHDLERILSLVGVVAVSALPMDTIVGSCDTECYTIAGIMTLRTTGTTSVQTISCAVVQILSNTQFLTQTVSKIGGLEAIRYTGDPYICTTSPNNATNTTMGNSSTSTTTTTNTTTTSQGGQPQPAQQQQPSGQQQVQQQQQQGSSSTVGLPLGLALGIIGFTVALSFVALTYRRRRQQQYATDSVYESAFPMEKEDASSFGPISSIPTFTSTSSNLVMSPISNGEIEVMTPMSSGIDENASKRMDLSTNDYAEEEEEKRSPLTPSLPPSVDNVVDEEDYILFSPVVDAGNKGEEGNEQELAFDPNSDIIFDPSSDEQQEENSKSIVPDACDLGDDDDDDDDDDNDDDRRALLPKVSEKKDFEKSSTTSSGPPPLEQMYQKISELLPSQAPQAPLIQQPLRHIWDRNPYRSSCLESSPPQLTPIKEIDSSCSYDASGSERTLQIVPSPLLSKSSSFDNDPPREEETMLQLSMSGEVLSLGAAEQKIKVANKKLDYDESSTGSI